MPVISQSVTINAPVGKVFDFVVNPDNWTRYVTSLVDVTDASPEIPQAGATFSWVYKMIGLKFAGKGTVSIFEKDKAFGLKLEGKHVINESYDFSSSGNGATDLKIKIDYEIPNAVLGALASSRLVEKLNELEARSVLERIKNMCEES